MRKREVSGRTPGAPVVEIENIPTGAANLLGQIQIALVPGKSVQQHHHRMRTRSSSHIDEGVQEPTMARNLKTLHGSALPPAERGKHAHRQQGGTAIRWRSLALKNRSGRKSAAATQGSETSLWLCRAASEAGNFCNECASILPE